MPLPQASPFTLRLFQRKGNGGGERGREKEGEEKAKEGTRKGMGKAEKRKGRGKKERLREKKEERERMKERGKEWKREKSVGEEGLGEEAGPSWSFYCKTPQPKVTWRGKGLFQLILPTLWEVST